MGSPDMMEAWDEMALKIDGYDAMLAERDAAVRIAEQRAAQMEQLDSLILWQGKTIERRAGVVRAAVEWKAALDASRSVGFGPIGCEDDPVWQREQAEHVRIAGERHERFHLAYIALEEAVDALAEPPAISLDEGWGDEYAAVRQDATPSLSEMVAEWAGVPVDAITEADHKRWLDWLRDCEEMGR